MDNLCYLFIHFSVWVILVLYCYFACFVTFCLTNGIFWVCWNLGNHNPLLPPRSPPWILLLFLVTAVVSLFLSTNFVWCVFIAVWPLKSLLTYWSISDLTDFLKHLEPKPKQNHLIFFVDELFLLESSLNTQARSLQLCLSIHFLQKIWCSAGHEGLGASQVFSYIASPRHAQIYLDSLEYVGDFQSP